MGPTLTPALPNKRYSIIYADPPWHHTNVIRNRAKAHYGAYQQYPVMKTPEICALPISEIAEANSLLFLWTTGALFEDGMQVGRAWGYKFATVAFVWNKPNKKLPGFYTMSQCEFCLVLKRGKIPQPRGKRNISQFLECKGGRHAEKPAEIRERITKMFPLQTKIELFARQRFEGWDAWGNEIETTQPHKVEVEQPEQQLVFDMDY